jgi:alpha-ketoglutarate-dependent taurine dioxygenase
MVLNANNCSESGHQQSIADLRLSDLRRLTLDHSLVLLRGFRPLSIDAFRAAAKQIGQIQEWVFGDLLVVKESTERDLNNVCTREAMPMHFDGTFKTITDPISGKQVPNAPL